MPFESRFFRAAVPARVFASALGLLTVLGSPSGTSAQAPVVAPAAPAAPSATTPAVPGATTPVATTPSATTPAVPAATIPATPKLGAAAAPVPVIAPASGESTQGAMQITDLLASLARFDRDGRVAAQKIGFEIPERAVNEYLAYSLRNKPRPGISAITVSLLPKNDISAMIEIDFNSVTEWNPEILPEPLRPLLSGKRTIQLNAHFESKNGTFTFSLKDVHGPDGKLLVNKIMTDLIQSIGSRQPESYDAAKPLPLPFGLRRVWTEKQSVMGET
jgi:hypothetical protein